MFKAKANDRGQRRKVYAKMQRPRTQTQMVQGQGQGQTQRRKKKKSLQRNVSGDLPIKKKVFKQIFLAN